jgi:hypothetical protein
VRRSSRAALFTWDWETDPGTRLVAYLFSTTCFDSRGHQCVLPGHQAMAEASDARKDLTFPCPCGTPFSWRLFFYRDRLFRNNGSVE